MPCQIAKGICCQQCMVAAVLPGFGGMCRGHQRDRAMILLTAPTKPHPLDRGTACAQVPRRRQAQTSISVVHGHKPDGSGLLNMLLSLFGWRSQQRNKVSVDCSTLATLKQGLKCSLLLRLVFPGGKLRHTAVEQFLRILQDLTEGKLS